MKKTFIFIILLFTFTSYSQLPKGDRILAWHIDVTQNGNYDSAYAYAQTACMESLHLSFAWSSIEPNSGNFDTNYINNVLNVANIYYPACGMKIELSIPTMNVNRKETPSDLLSVDFDNPLMISRFKTLLDTLFSYIPDVQLSVLNIGNESDIYMGTDAIQYTKYKIFLDSIIPYTKQLYFNLHGTGLKVGTIFTYDGLVGASTSTLCQTVNNGLDIVALTYYPLNPDFTMESPTVVISDFSNLISIYSDTLQPIYFAECGYASSDSCNSSDALQSQFYQDIFAAWDTYYDNIKYLTIFKTTDWSQQTANNLGVFFGITDNTFLEFLRTLGVRTWDNDGINKPAYETILCELNARGWCSVNCTTTEIKDLAEIPSFSIYPNPAKNIIHINHREDIQIYNQIGELVFTSKMESNQINLSNLSNGVYIIRLKNRIPQKIIISND